VQAKLKRKKRDFIDAKLSADARVKKSRMEHDFRVPFFVVRAIWAKSLRRIAEGRGHYSAPNCEAGSVNVVEAVRTCAPL